MDKNDVEREPMPKLALGRSPVTRSPSDFSLLTSSLFSAEVSFSDADGLETGTVLRYQFADREQRREFSGKSVSILKQLRTIDSRCRLFSALEALIEYDDCSQEVASSLGLMWSACELFWGDVEMAWVSLTLSLCCSPDTTVLSKVADSCSYVFQQGDVPTVTRTLVPMVACLPLSPWSSPRIVGANLLVDLAQCASLPSYGMLVSGKHFVNIRDAAHLGWFFSIGDAVMTLQKEKHRVLLRGAGYSDGLRSVIPSSAEWCGAVQSVFLDCCVDCDPQVKISACRSLHRWTRITEHHSLTASIYPLLQSLLLDEELHDNVLIELVRQVVLIAQIVGRSDATKFLLHLYQSCTQKRSWRVRYVSATLAGVFISCVADATAVLLDDLRRLMNDEEMQIQCAATRQIPAFFATVASCENSLLSLQGIVASLINLGNSPHQSIRESVASVAYVLVLISPDDQQAMDVSVRLMKDPSEAVIRVAIESLQALGPLFQQRPGIFRAFLPHIKEQAASPKWRIRWQVMLLVRQLAEYLNSDVLHEIVSGVVSILGLRDATAQVRSAAVDVLAAASHLHGPQWSADCFQSLAKTVFSKGQLEGRATNRIVAVKCMGALLPVSAGILSVTPQWQLINANVQHLVNTLSRDPVSNVRIVVGRMLLTLTACQCGFASREVRDALERLILDDDRDVAAAAA